MDIYSPELALTIGISLLVSFLIAKIFLCCSNMDFDREYSARSCNKTTVKPRTGVEVEGESVGYGLELGTKIRFVGKLVELMSGGRGGSVGEVSLGGNSTEGFRGDMEDDEESDYINKASVGEGSEDGEVYVVDETFERGKDCGVEIRLMKGKVCGAESDEEIEGAEKDTEAMFDEDDWEGIERTELDEMFSSAVAFVGSKSSTDRIRGLENDVNVMLYGLHRAATEGPCYKTAPMAWKVSARAKWNAWQRLGNMSPEEAMEQYVTLLSKNIPGWMEDDTDGHGNQAMAHVAASKELKSELDTFRNNHSPDKCERNPDELNCNAEGSNVIDSIINNHEIGENKD